MKRLALLPIIFALLLSCAVPTGAVFALDEPNMPAPETVTATVDPESEGGESEAPSIEQIIAEPAAPAEVATENQVSAPLVQPAEIVAAPDPPIVAPPAPTPLPASPLLITAYQATGAHLNAVQLYNNSSDMVPLTGVSLTYVADDTEYQIPLVDGWIKPRSYIVAAWQGESDNADIAFQFASVGVGALQTIELDHEGYQSLVVTTPTNYGGQLLQRFKSTAGNYTTNTSFSMGSPTISGGGLYTLPDAPTLSVREILVNPRDCVVGSETPDCYDYIKVRNDGDSALHLSQYRLRSGYSNTDSSSSNTAYFDTILAPGEVRTLAYDHDGEHLNFTANDGTVWLEDSYGFTTYDLGVPPHVDSDLTANTGRSWAYNDTTEAWQWTTPSPNEVDNNFTVTADPGKGSVTDTSSLKPCNDDQYRSEETGRCRNVVVASTLTPCKDGQYRSEETNRCRSIATAAASVLKPCADDQFRNPTTNRCKTIASADDVALVDCGEGRERNPETNRCRNILLTTPPEAAFAVTPTTTSPSVFNGWWAFGALALVGAGYGVWEWRVELLGFVRHLPGIGRS